MGGVYGCCKISFYFILAHPHLLPAENGGKCFDIRWAFGSDSHRIELFRVVLIVD